ncbi:hypothetical protein [Clostridium sp.]|uniref:hypothetical protein n=1 Tax=Clostridium sp. TaxID=1506 RepID=UPI003464E797
MESQSSDIYDQNVFGDFIPFQDKNYNLLNNSVIPFSFKSTYNFSNMIPLNSFGGNMAFHFSPIPFSPKTYLILTLESLEEYLNTNLSNFLE